MAGGPDPRKPQGFSSLPPEPAPGVLPVSSFDMGHAPGSPDLTVSDAPGHGGEASEAEVPVELMENELLTRAMEALEKSVAAYQGTKGPSGIPGCLVARHSGFLVEPSNDETETLVDSLWVLGALDGVSAEEVAELRQASDTYDVDMIRTCLDTALDAANKCLNEGLPDAEAFVIEALEAPNDAGTGLMLWRKADFTDRLDLSAAPGRVTITKNRMGNAEIASYFGESIYVQVDTDVKALVEMMTYWDRYPFENGWPVVMDDPGYFQDQVGGFLLKEPVEDRAGVTRVHLESGLPFVALPPGDDLDVAILRRGVIGGAAVLIPGKNPEDYLGNWIGAIRLPNPDRVADRLADIHGGTRSFISDMGKVRRPVAVGDSFNLNSLDEAENPGQIFYRISNASRQRADLMTWENRWRPILVADPDFGTALAISDLLERRGREKAVGLVSIVTPVNEGSKRLTYGAVPLADGEQRYVCLAEGRTRDYSSGQMAGFTYGSMRVVPAGEARPDLKQWVRAQLEAASPLSVGQQALLLGPAELSKLTGDPLVWDAGLADSVPVADAVLKTWSEVAQSVRATASLLQ